MFPWLDIFFLIYLFLQYYVGFSHRSVWISHRYTRVPSLMNLPPISYPIPPTPRLSKLARYLNEWNFKDIFNATGIMIKLYFSKRKLTDQYSDLNLELYQDCNHSSHLTLSGSMRGSFDEELGAWGLLNYTREKTVKAQTHFQQVP